ncbi:MAG: flagellar biosynthesis anti-sigma factor FlgM [Myxococcota bacterium]
MKITTSSPMSPVTSTPGPEGPKVDRAEPPRATRVSLSEDAKWVAAVAEEARRTPEVREDVVRRTRDAIAQGTWDHSVDLDRVVDGLLADL